MQEKETRWKTSLLPFATCLCFFIFLTGCWDTDKDPGIPEFQPDTSDTTPGDISDRLVARIYFDATLSMQGFVVPGSTRYTQIHPYLESVIVSGWTDGKADFFRFGEQVEDIDRDTYLNVAHPDFYEDENIYRETFIEKIIDYESQLSSDQRNINNAPEESTESEISDIPEESAEVVTPTEEINDSQTKESQLVVIVTDLFQDRGDINLLVAQLKEEFIKNGLEVGLFGLRSQFDGEVYDTGIGQAPIIHRSDPNNPETFRPFYLLVLGRHADIAHYFDRLKANTPDAQTIIFSRYLVSRLVSFEDVADGTPIQLTELNNKTYVRSEDPRLKQYEIVRSSEPAKISAKMEYVPLPHAMPFNFNTFEVSIIAEHKPDRNGENERSPEAINCLEVTPTFSENELTVEFALTTSLPRRAVYLYEVTLHPAIDTYKVPDWCSGWDMGMGRNGARTLNLVNFVRGLTEITAREHHPKIAQFYFYIGKR